MLWEILAHTESYASWRSLSESKIMHNAVNHLPKGVGYAAMVMLDYRQGQRKD